MVFWSQVDRYHPVLQVEACVLSLQPCFLLFLPSLITPGRIFFLSVQSQLLPLLYFSELHPDNGNQPDNGDPEDHQVFVNDKLIVGGRGKDLDCLLGLLAPERRDQKCNQEGKANCQRHVIS